MIFENLTIKNFGIYKGDHEIDLDSQDHVKPIILIGALNGGGKTTFLDALQLALYGKHAKCSNRGRLSYAAYLEQTINRYATEKEASITLRFRHETAGKKHVYEINRAWEKHDHKECKESVVVSYNGRPDALLSEHWDEFINEFIPQSLSELFFFDGEKIENLADPARSAELVKTGIEALLGLELLAQLNIDLGVLKNRKQEELLDEKQRIKLIEAEARLTQLKNTRNALDKDFSEAIEDLENKKAEASYWQKQLQDNGAHLIATKDEITREETRLKVILENINAELVKLAAGALPLKLVFPLIEDTKAQLQKEANIKQYQSARSLLLNQEEKILDILKKQNVSSSQLTLLKNQLSEERATSDSLYSEPCYLNSDPSIFNGLYERLEKEESEAQLLLARKAELSSELDLVKRKLETIPDAKSVQHIIERSVESDRDQLLAENKRSETLTQIQQLEEALLQAEEQLNAIRVQGNALGFEQQRQQQLSEHMVKLQDIVVEFKNDLVKENIERLQRKIKSKFDTIKRKESLIREIKIDPDSFILTLLAQDMRPIAPNRLSAGERQLLAISVLWGLADESGKELPTIIDTPMGRLDGKHRSRLIEEYFPMAAAQVILLSTDEEIKGSYYHKLKPYIAKEYHISYEEEQFTSTIRPGYFPEEKG